jgi:RNA polymerase sigma-70 factor (ECF subfamily)
MSDPQSVGAYPAREFTELLQSSQTALYAFTRHLLANSEDARDVVQDVYVQAWRAAQRGSPPFEGAWREEDALTRRGWLFTVAYRQAVSLLRHRQVITWHSLEVIDEECAPLATGAHQAAEPFENQIVEGEVLRAALARLKPDDAACLLLRIVQGFSIFQIAQIVGIAPDAARKRFSRAVERLRGAYFEHELGRQQTPPTPKPARERVDR